MITIINKATVARLRPPCDSDYIILIIIIIIVIVIVIVIIVIIRELSAIIRP